MEAITEVLESRKQLLVLALTRGELSSGSLSHLLEEFGAGCLQIVSVCRTQGAGIETPISLTVLLLITENPVWGNRPGQLCGKRPELGCKAGNFKVRHLFRQLTHLGICHVRGTA